MWASLYHTYNLNEDAIFSLKFWKPPDPAAASATRLNRVAACFSNGKDICMGKVVQVGFKA
jgi:hypothetical protein